MNKLLDIFDLVPGWVWASSFAVLLAVVFSLNVQLIAEQGAHASARASHAAQAAESERAARLQAEKYRTKEQELARAEDTHAHEIASLRADLDAARARSAVVAERLRDAARGTAQRAAEAATNPDSAELRQAAQNATRMLAELRERADERAGVLARFATDAHLAGLACERRYDEAREALKE